jgi:hypothetical protein
MNERIRELYSDSVQYAFDQRFSPTGKRELQEVINEKFAELIVKECFTKLTPYMDDQFINDIEEELNEHFGIKE